MLFIFSGVIIIPLKVNKIKPKKHYKVDYWNNKMKILSFGKGKEEFVKYFLKNTSIKQLGKLSDFIDVSRVSLNEKKIVFFVGDKEVINKLLLKYGTKSTVDVSRAKVVIDLGSDTIQDKIDLAYKLYKRGFFGEFDVSKELSFGKENKLVITHKDRDYIYFPNGGMASCSTLYEPEKEDISEMHTLDYASFTIYDVEFF